MSHIVYELRGKVAVIQFFNPPVNSLGHPLRVELVAALHRAAADSNAQAIVLYGQGGLFSAGADIREFNTPLARRAPTLHDLIATAEGGSKPVVSAISGTCLGGGLELALGCHHRVSSAQALLGLPESKLGLLPGAGGTQRLPRLVGIKLSLDMILSGEPAAASRLAQTALLDRIVESDPLDAAVEFAQQLTEQGTPPRKVSELRVLDPDIQALCQSARNKVKEKFPHFPALLRCVDAIEASAKPFEEGSQIERSYFLALLESSESKALRHVFFAERAASRIADVPGDAPVREIREAAVVGAGTMGSGIAVCLLNAGIPVTLIEADRDALNNGIGRIKEVYAALVRKDRLKPEQSQERLSLLTPAVTYDCLQSADIIIEAVFEEMSVKEAVFRSLDAVAKRGAILATNTSTLDVNRIAHFTRRPEDVVGTHFFSPAHIMRLLEVVRGESTAKDVLATVMNLAKRLRKIAVVSGVCDGFIGNRMFQEYVRQAGFLLDAGASPLEVDTAMEAFGFAMGPFRVGDLAGNDIGWRIRQRRAVEQPQVIYSKLPDKLCELRRFGQKSLAGWYDYRPGDRTAYPSKVVDELIAQHRVEIGIQPRSFDPAEIVDRLVYVLVNEGAKILQEKIAARASDIDVVYLNGYGFPIFRGGPMFYADAVGLSQVLHRMEELAADPLGDPAAWQPASLLTKLAAEGGSFSASGVST